MLKIAFRNVFRNRRRSVLSLAIIGLGSTMLFLVGGYVAQSLASMTTGFSSYYGHIQIADIGFWDRSDELSDYLLRPLGRLATIERVLAEHPIVESWTTRLDFSGLLGNDKETAMVLGTGVEPENLTTEPVHPIAVSGRPLRANRSDEILLGVTLAENLDALPGSRINLAGFAVTESLNAMTIDVAGTFKFFNSEMEAQATFVPLALAQGLLRTDGVDRVIVRLSESTAVEATATSIQASFDQEGLDLEVRPWEDIAPFYTEMKSFYGAIDGLSTVAVFLLAFFGILQVLMMSFMERTREVGTLRAVGTKRSQVFRMFLTEGVVLGILGGLLGVAAGFGIGAAINAADIVWMYPGATQPAPVAIQLAAGNALAPLIIGLLAALLSAVYPALNAARSDVVEALHHV